MLAIRQEQLDAFQSVAKENFETKMVKHCKAVSPHSTQTLKETQLQLAVREAIARANSYGFSQQGPVRLFIELTLLYGWAFDTDPQYPWATPILTDTTEEQMKRAERLYEKTRHYTARVKGYQNEYTQAALGKLAERLQDAPSFSPATFVDFMLKETQALYPEKAKFVGNETLKELIRKAINQARVYDINDGHGFVLFYTLMFSLGHGCTKDPYYPWIQQTLKDATKSDPEARVKSLETVALKWLERVKHSVEGE